METQRRHDVGVISGGSARYAAARTTRELGADVVIVDHRPLGGLCILRGCMPTNAILRSSEVASLLADSYPFADQGKALCLGATQGFAELFAAPQAGEILGAQIVGPEAGELFRELIAVMYDHGTDLLRMPHYHPTLGEIVTYPAESIVEQMRGR